MGWIQAGWIQEFKMAKHTPTGDVKFVLGQTVSVFISESVGWGRGVGVGW